MAHGSNEHPMPNEVDRPSNLLIAGMVIFFVVALLAVLLAVDSLVTWTFQDQYQKKVWSLDNAALRELRAAEATKLADYSWADQPGGAVRLPLDRAVELTLRDWPSRLADVAAEVIEAEAGQGAQQ